MSKQEFQGSFPSYFIALSDFIRHYLWRCDLPGKAIYCRMYQSTARGAFLWQLPRVTSDRSPIVIALRRLTQYYGRFSGYRATNDALLP